VCVAVWAGSSDPLTSVQPSVASQGGSGSSHRGPGGRNVVSNKTLLLWPGALVAGRPAGGCVHTGPLGRAFAVVPPGPVVDTNAAVVAWGRGRRAAASQIIVSRGRRRGRRRASRPFNKLDLP
jgi:hypothetical protein